LLARTDGFHVYDLAEEWKRFTGKSFVFAFWAVRKQALQDQGGTRVADAFQKSRDKRVCSLRTIAKIAKEWSVRLSLPRKVDKQLSHQQHLLQTRL